MHSFTAGATISAVGEARKSADVSRTRHPTEGPLDGLFAKVAEALFERMKKFGMIYAKAICLICSLPRLFLKPTPGS
jgi:hypothetical protein